MGTAAAIDSMTRIPHRPAPKSETGTWEVMLFYGGRFRGSYSEVQKHPARVKGTERKVNPHGRPEKPLFSHNYR